MFLDGDNQISIDRQSASSTFYIDPTPAPPPPLRQTNSSNNQKMNNNNHQSTFYYQPPPPQFVPTRPPPPVPVLVNSQSLTFKNLSLNPIHPSNDIVTDLLDLGDPGSPPPSPKFDPYG